MASIQARPRAPGICFALAVLFLAPQALANLNIYSPANGGYALGNQVTVDVRGCGKHPSHLVTKLNGHAFPLSWKRGPYANQWLAQLELPGPGKHELRFTGKCKGRTRFESRTHGTVDIAQRLARHFQRHNSARRQDWDWGPAVFLYGLYKLEPQSAYVRRYQAHWARKGIKAPNKSDACPAALTGLALYRDSGDPVGLRNAHKVAHYLATEPRNALGVLDHLGHSFWRFLYPNSIWVDSLMMEALFATQWGKLSGDPEMRDFGARQPGIFASVLQDRATGLFYHAWLIKKKKRIPASKTFWLRGNGWVLAAIAEIADELEPTDPYRAEMLAVFKRLVDGLKPYQQETGLWDNVLNLPGYSYGETSGTALVAFAVAKGVHRGWLPPEDMNMAKRAFAAVTSRLRPAAEKGELSMPRIAWFTNPGPRYTYRLTPAVSDISYGVGAYLLAAAEFKDDEF